MRRTYVLLEARSKLGRPASWISLIFVYSFNINEKITEIVERASINDIRNNITFYRMENDIYDICLGYGEYLIQNIHMPFPLHIYGYIHHLH